MACSADNVRLSDDTVRKSHRDATSDPAASATANAVNSSRPRDTEVSGTASNITATTFNASKAHFASAFYSAEEAERGSYSYLSTCSSRSWSGVDTRQPFLPACCLIGICYRNFAAFNCRHRSDVTEVSLIHFILLGRSIHQLLRHDDAPLPDPALKRSELAPAVTVGITGHQPSSNSAAFASGCC